MMLYSSFSFVLFDLSLYVRSPSVFTVSLCSLSLCVHTLSLCSPHILGLWSSNRYASIESYTIFLQWISLSLVEASQLVSGQGGGEMTFSNIDQMATSIDK